MADIDFASLPNKTSGTLIGTEQIIMNDSGIAKDVTLTELKANIKAEFNTIEVTNSAIKSGVVFNTPLIDVPDLSKPFKESSTYSGGEAKFGKWRQYHNAAEWGWGITYNTPLNPYSVYPPASGARDVAGTTASSCVAMRFDVAEGASGMNFWGIDWAPPSATNTAPDWAWGPNLFFYQGDVIGVAGAAGGTLRVASSAGRESALILESSNTATNRSYSVRTAYTGEFQIRDTSAWTNWNSMPSGSDGELRMEISNEGNIHFPGSVEPTGGTLSKVQYVPNPVSASLITSAFNTEVLIIDSSSVTAALTIKFPDLYGNTANQVGRKFTITTFNDITSITLQTPSTNISGAITSLDGGTSVSWVYYTNNVGISTWFRA